jgi:hypothetical protein
MEGASQTPAPRTPGSTLGAVRPCDHAGLYLMVGCGGPGDTRCGGGRRAAAGQPGGDRVAVRPPDARLQSLRLGRPRTPPTPLASVLWSDSVWVQRRARVGLEGGWAAAVLDGAVRHASMALLDAQAGADDRWADGATTGRVESELTRMGADTQTVGSLMLRQQLQDKQRRHRAFIDFLAAAGLLDRVRPLHQRERGKTDAYASCRLRRGTRCRSTQRRRRRRSRCAGTRTTSRRGASLSARRRTVLT